MPKKKISLRGRSFIGIVISDKMHKSAVVEWNKKTKIPKYERYRLKRKKVTVHVPDDIQVEKGDMVRINETRPLSKTKHFVIVEKLGFEKTHIIKEETKDKADQRVHKKETENDGS